MLKDIASGKESVQSVDEKVGHYDVETGIVDNRSIRDHSQVQLIRQAKKLTSLSVEMEQYKNFYENELLKTMMLPGTDASAQES